MDDSADSQEPQFLYEVTRRFCDYVDEKTQAALDKKRNALFDEIQDELANTENPFQVLLRRFRRAHIEHGQAFLGLELLTQNELEGRRKDSLKNIIIEDDVINVVGSLSFGNPQTDHPQTDNLFFIVAFAGGIRVEYSHLNKGYLSFKHLVAIGKVETEREYHKNLYFRDVIEHVIEALEVYVPLAKIAGSCVPARIRKAMPVEPCDASSIWNSLLHWMNNPDSSSLNLHPKYRRYPKRRRMLSDSVFQDSIDAIEKYLLGAGESVLPGAHQELAGDVNYGPPDAHRAHQEKLFPNGLPGDTDLVDAIVRLDTERRPGLSDIEILRKFMSETKGACPKAKRMASRIRKARNSGRTTLPSRQK